MSDLEYEESRKGKLEEFSAKHFATFITVRKVLFDELALSPSATMTVFSTDDNNIYAAIESDTVLRLGDVERLVKEAGFRPTHYAAPQGHKGYFIQHAYNIFTAVYPGRTKWTPDQETYYQLLAPYSPALVKLGGMFGSVRQYNTFGKVWQVVYRPSDRIYTAGR